MTRLALAMAVAVFAMTPAARAETPPSCPRGTGTLTTAHAGGAIIREGQGLGHVSIGTALADVERAWGAPFQCMPQDDGWMMTYTLTDDASGKAEAIVVVVMAQTSVKGLIIMAPRRGGVDAPSSLRTSRGAGLGASPARVRQIYGAPDRGVAELLVYAAQGVALQAVDGRVGAIFVFQAGAPPGWLTP